MDSDYLELTGSQWAQMTAFVMQVMNRLGYNKNTKTAEDRFSRLRLRIHAPKADGKMCVDFSEGL